MTLKALQVDPQGNATEVDLPNADPEGFIPAVRELVAAECIQVLELTSRWDLWLDEDGTPSRPINPYATALANLYGISWTLRGPAVITGADRDVGVAAPLTSAQIDAIRARIVLAGRIHDHNPDAPGTDGPLR